MTVDDTYWGKDGAPPQRPSSIDDDSIAEIEAIAARLARLGQVLFAHGAIIGPDRVKGKSRDGYGDERIVALAVVVEISADLGASALALLSAGNAYSAAVLLRQIIEAEYLMWLFANDPEAARTWLNASKWWPEFSPATIRGKSAGQFSSDEYHCHCEIGGHPTPNARDLLSNHSRGVDTSWLWQELEYHLTRLWEKVELAADRMGVGEVIPTEEQGDHDNDEMEPQSA